jgi:hypothetical protein
VIVHDLHIVGVPVVPDETDPVLIVDPNAVLAAREPTQVRMRRGADAMLLIRRARQRTVLTSSNAPAVVLGWDRNFTVTRSFPRVIAPGMRYSLSSSSVGWYSSDSVAIF